MANEVSKTFEDLLTDKLQMVSSALPKDMNKDRFAHWTVKRCLPWT